MTHRALLLFACAGVLGAQPVEHCGVTGNFLSPHAVMKSVDLGAVRWTRGFWADRFELARSSTMPEMWRAMNRHGNGASYHNLLIASGRQIGEFKGNQWSDGDVYKWLEGAAQIFGVTRDAALDRLMDEVIEVIGKAQEPDGYISTRNQLNKEKRWKEPRDHEMYNMGHLMTAAAIHHRITGKRSLLAVAQKAADYLVPLFESQTAQLAHFSAPSNIMGVVELYRTTRDPRYLQLATTLVEMRGTVPGGTDAFQSRVPLRNESEAVGHAVHATYLYATAADLIAETGDRQLRGVLERIWDDVTSRKMYVTGAVGPNDPGLSLRRDRVGEAFGDPFDLPHRLGYNETCANIGHALWNWRMLAISGDAKFADRMELILYNSMLSGMGIGGNDFFYTNVHRRHGPEVPLLRNETPLRWTNTVDKPSANSFCCPPNVLRMLAGMHGYAYGLSADTVWVNLYGSNVLKTQLPGGEAFEVEQETDYPWGGRVKLTVKTAAKHEVALKLRVPGWAETAALRVNGQSMEAPAGRYAEIRRRWTAGEIVELVIPMEPRLVEAHPWVEAARHQVSVMRGPVVYCAESPDMPAGVGIAELRIPRGIRLTPRYDHGLLGGISVLEGRAFHVRQTTESSNDPFRPVSAARAEAIQLRLIPYYAWANRGLSQMTVWIRLAD